MQDFSRRLKTVREESGYGTAKDFAIQLGMQETAYRKYERGLSVPPLDKLELIANITDSSLDFLLLGKAANQSTRKRQLIRSAAP